MYAWEGSEGWAEPEGERSLSYFLHSVCFQCQPCCSHAKAPSTSGSNMGTPAGMLEPQRWGLRTALLAPADTQPHVKNDTSNVSTQHCKGKEKKDPIRKMSAAILRGLAGSQEMEEARWKELARLKEECVRMERTSERCERLKDLTF